MSWFKGILLIGLGEVLLLQGVAACTPLATLNALASSDAHTLVGDVAYGPLP